MTKCQMIKATFICSLTLLSFRCVLAQATIQQLLYNGATDRRINIVFLSEGYTNTQLSQYTTDATTLLNALLSSVPYNNYSRYFNAFAISVASIESGSDHPSRNVYRDTYFNSTYDSFGYARLITINNIGEQRKNSLLQALMPEYDIVVMIVNDAEYGGSGAPDLAIVSVNTASVEILLHELGHSFAELTDEYETAYPEWTPREFPNSTSRATVTSLTTGQITRELIKWNSFILSTTPIDPTPEEGTYSEVIGLFEGSQYQTTGWYRPKLLNCKMNILGVPFCEVCSEATVISVYTLVRPIESYLPTDSVVFMTDTEWSLFSIVPMRPSSYNLLVQWFVDGTQRTGATTPSFSASGQELGIGNHTLQVTVRDTTSLVRNDPSGQLRNSIYWTVVVYSASSSITGYVRTSVGTGISDAVMNGLPGNPSTDANGYYTGTVYYGWSGTVTPTRTGYSFSPPSTSYSFVTTNQSTNYTGTLQTFTISGYVSTSGGTGINGVVMNGLPGNPNTDANGYYIGTVYYGWSGTVTPTRTGYSFIPPSTSYSNVTTNQLTNYTGTGPTSVEQLSTLLPTAYSVEQNYPNPFNPTTIIRFSLPEQSTVSLMIFDLTGKEVNRVMDAVPLSAGTFETAWHGTNAQGRLVTSGVYLARFVAVSENAGNRLFTGIIKLIVLK